MTADDTRDLIRAGMSDRRLRQHHAFVVLVQLTDLLVADTPRPVYQSSLALALHLNRATVRLAMRCLVRRGYLREVAPTARAVRQFALATPPTRPRDVVTSSPRQPVPPVAPDAADA